MGLQLNDVTHSLNLLVVEVLGDMGVRLVKRHVKEALRYGGVGRRVAKESHVVWCVVELGRSTGTVSLIVWNSTTLKVRVQAGRRLLVRTVRSLTPGLVVWNLGASVAASYCGT